MLKFSGFVYLTSCLLGVSSWQTQQWPTHKQCTCSKAGGVRKFHATLRINIDININAQDAQTQAHAQLANNEEDMLSGNAQKRIPHSTTNWFTEFCKSLCLSQFTAPFISVWAKASIAEHVWEQQIPQKIYINTLHSSRHTPGSTINAPCCPPVTKCGCHCMTTHTKHRHAQFTFLNHMQMILPQVHLRKPCYDFSFL